MIEPPDPKYVLASLLSVVALVLPDALDLGLAPAIYMFGSVCVVVVPVIVVDTLATKLPVGPATAVWYVRSAFLLAFGVPVVYAILCLAPVGFRPMPAAVPLFSAFAGVAAFVCIAGLKRAGRAGAMASKAGHNGELWRALAIASLQLGVLFLGAHAWEGTLTSVNPGTQGQREVVYVAMWGVSLVLTVPFAMRIWVRAGGEVSAVASGAGGALGVAAAATCLYVDRYWLVDLHPSLHVWLQFIGVLSLDAALSLGLSRVRTRRRVLGLGVGGALAMVVMLAATAFHLGREASVELRTKAEYSVLGSSIALMGPVDRASSLPPVRDDARLHFDRHHSYEVEPNDFNILLISVDALRHDRVPKSNNRNKKRKRFANLGRLASESSNFRHAYSPGTRTAIGMGSIMVGRYSANIDWDLWLPTRTDGKYGVRALKSLSVEEVNSLPLEQPFTTFPDFDGMGTVAQRLQRAGYRTMAVPYGGSKASKWFGRTTGFGLGFDDLHEFPRKLRTPTSPRVIKLALAQIDEATTTGQKWFQWIHLYAPHSAKSRKSYRRRVAIVDKGLGQLIAGLKQRGLYDRTVIMLTSDHGEAFGEHRHRGHATSLYGEQARVPLLLRIPNVEPRRYQRPVSSLDGIATVLALAGAELEAVDGMNLLPIIDGVDVPRHPVFTELHRYTNGRQGKDLHAVIFDGWKLIYNRKNDTMKLFNLEADPRERKDVAGEQADALDGLARLLSAFLYRGEKAHPLPETPKMLVE